MQIVSQHNHDAEALLRCGEQKITNIAECSTIFRTSGATTRNFKFIGIFCTEKKHATTNEHIQILAPH